MKLLDQVFNLEECDVDYTTENLTLVSVDQSGKNNIFYGQKHSEETKEHLRQMNLGSNNPRYGKKLSKKHREDISKALSGRPKSEKFKQIISARMKGENNPLYGKPAWNKGKTGFPKSLESKKKVAKAVEYMGVEYWSIGEAARQNNSTGYKIMKHPSFKFK